MKLTVTQENLSRAISAVSRVANGKALPILHNILLRTDNNRLQIAATNLEIAITEHIGAKVTTNGAVTVPAKLMSEFISNLPKGNIELSSEGAKLHISAGAYSSTINGIEAEEFPELPSINESEAVSYEVSTDILKRATTQTTIATSNDTTRPMLTGVYCHSHDGQLYFASTDGYRLAERRIGEMSQDISAIIPASTLQDVLRVVPDDCETVEMLIDETQVRFRMDDAEITSRLIDATFVDYRKLIPDSSDITATVKKDDFVRITKIASLFARESGGGVTLHTDSEKGTLSVQSVASQLGENTSEAEADVSADGTVTLNSRYLIEALGAIDSDTVQFRFSGKLAPCVLTATKDGADYQHIIMPLKS